jgi:hypothetical protein
MTIAGVVTLQLQRTIWRGYLRMKRRAGARVEA